MFEKVLCSYFSFYIFKEKDNIRYTRKCKKFLKKCSFFGRIMCKNETCR